MVSILILPNGARGGNEDRADEPTTRIWRNTSGASATNSSNGVIDLHRWDFSSRGSGAFVTATPAIIGMEACPGAQWLARKLRSFGHDVRFLPAQLVKPSVKSNKNDNNDAEAIAEAVRRRPTMRFVPASACLRMLMICLSVHRDFFK